MRNLLRETILSGPPPQAHGPSNPIVNRLRLEMLAEVREGLGATIRSLTAEEQWHAKSAHDARDAGRAQEAAAHDAEAARVREELEQWQARARRQVEYLNSAGFAGHVNRMVALELSRQGRRAAELRQALEGQTARSEELQAKLDALETVGRAAAREALEAMRRADAKAANPAPEEDKPYRLEQPHRFVWRGRRPVDFPPIPYLLLVYLLEHPEATEKEVMKSVWGDRRTETGTVRTAVYEVTSRLADAGIPITISRKSGGIYLTFDPDPGQQKVSKR